MTPAGVLCPATLGHKIHYEEILKCRKMQKRSNEVRMTPDYLFEVSWEVCNKVGGIHTVIATKALTITEQLGDRYILIGPDVHREDVNLEFEEDSELLKDWKQALFTNDNIRVKIGHWKVKGSPIAILVDFSQFFSSKDDVLKFLWESYRVDSISGQGTTSSPCCSARRRAR